MHSNVQSVRNVHSGAVELNRLKEFRLIEGTSFRNQLGDAIQAYLYLSLENLDELNQSELALSDRVECVSSCQQNPLDSLVDSVLDSNARFKARLASLKGEFSPGSAPA